jgi:hypothetical protein
MITNATDKELTMQLQVEDLRREVLAYSITCENAEMFDYKREALAWSITCENLEAGYV